MLSIVWHAHSGNRYLVLLAGLVLVGVSIFGLTGTNVPAKLSRILGALFAGLMDLQVLLGLVLLVLARFGGQVWGHLVLMLLATALMHVMHVRARKQPEAMHRWRLIGSAGALVLIAMGILAIGRGIFQTTVGGG